MDEQLYFSCALGLSLYWVSIFYEAHTNSSRRENMKMKKRKPEIKSPESIIFAIKSYDDDDDGFLL